MDRFDEMRTKGINTNDATATSGDIKKGQTAYVKGKKVTGTLEGGGQTIDSILPLPATSLNFNQALGEIGKGTLMFSIPDENLTDVDILIKKDNLPESITDYDKIINTGNNIDCKVEINFDKNDDGKYSKKYGIWAVTKNGNASQTAVYSNRKLFDLMYSDGSIFEYQIDGVSSYNYATVNCCLVKNFLFISAGYYSGTRNYASGLAVINLNTNEKKVLFNFSSSSNKGCIWRYFYEMKNNKILFSVRR